MLFPNRETLEPGAFRPPSQTAEWKGSAGAGWTGGTTPGGWYALGQQAPGGPAYDPVPAGMRSRPVFQAPRPGWTPPEGTVMPPGLQGGQAGSQTVPPAIRGGGRRPPQGGQGRAPWDRGDLMRLIQSIAPWLQRAGLGGQRPPWGG